MDAIDLTQAPSDDGSIEDDGSISLDESIMEHFKHLNTTTTEVRVNLFD